MLAVLWQRGKFTLLVEVKIVQYIVKCTMKQQMKSEWQFIGRPKMESYLTCLCADGKVFLVKDFISSEGNPNQQDSIIEYYDPDKNE